MSARDEVLGRIRTALGTAPVLGTAPAQGAAPVVGAAPAQGAAPGPGGYRVHSGLGQAALLDLLAGRLADYRSQVRRAAPGQVAEVIGAALAGRGARRLVIPPGLGLPGPVLPGPVLPGPGRPGPLGGVELVVDDGLTAQELDTFDGVITSAAVAIAETGTIILDGSAGQGRRALSLIPDYHLCLIQAGQVVGLVPEAIARLHPDRPLTWISGPSATSDIELDRVEGVHGPRTLEVILIG